jgi:hypothetical protein
MKKIWKRIVFEWKYPYGFCCKHNEKKDRWFGCWSCQKESAIQYAKEQREAKIQLLAEAHYRALVRFAQKETI